MAAASITLTVTQRWWLKHYLFGITALAHLTQREPNWTRVGYWIQKGINLKVC